MLLKERLRDTYVKYLFVMFFIAAQVLFITLSSYDRQAYKEYRYDAQSIKATASYTAYNWEIIADDSSRNQSSKEERDWAEKGLRIGDFVVGEYMRRANQDAEALMQDLPINADLELLLDLWFVKQADFGKYELPRPEVYLGEDKWNNLRNYYSEIGTPEDIVEMVFQPYNYYLEKDSEPAPVLRGDFFIGSSTIIFVYQKVKYYSDIILSDFPTMQYFSSPPGFWMLRIMSNRYLMILYFVIVVGISISGFYDDNDLGITKNLVSRPRGRRSYLISAFKNNTVLLLALFGFSAIPGLVVGLAKFGLKGATYPLRGFPYTFTNLAPYPLPRQEMMYLTKGGYFRLRQRMVELQNLEHMDAGVPLIKVSLISLLLLVLTTCVLVLISFVVGNLSKKRSVVYSMALVSIFVSGISFISPKIARLTFPFNPLSSADIVAVAMGCQDFTLLSSILSLTIWVVVLFVISDILIRKKSIG
ncbi:MAG: hypothetical protein Q4P65_03395 [Eubacteriales bacterium]|nr:hypothetical protein [Eubacteriales bacterium]